RPGTPSGCGGSVLVEADELGLVERVEVELKADDGRRGVSVDGELLGADGEDCEKVAMRMVALRRAGATVLALAGVVADHDRARGQRPAGGARTRGQLGHVGRDVGDDPMP